MGNNRIVLDWIGYKNNKFIEIGDKKDLLFLKEKGFY
jgi:hypothetical protein